MKLYQLAHHVELYRIRHSITAGFFVHAALGFLALVFLLVMIFLAIDIVTNTEQREAKAETDLRECVAVLNGDARMLDKDTGEIAKVTWSKVNLIGGEK